jgi:hypothetical protein
MATSSGKAADTTVGWTHFTRIWRHATGETLNISEILKAEIQNRAYSFYFFVLTAAC